MRPRRYLIDQPSQDTTKHTRNESLGAALAHAGTLVFGVPLAVLVLPTPFAFALCPVISYFISRRFRRQELSWGAFQALQAAVVQLIILSLLTLTVVANLPPRWELTFGAFWFLVLLYSLWGAIDTLMGYEFRYIFIGRWVETISKANLNRVEPRTRNQPINEEPANHRSRDHRWL